MKTNDMIGLWDEMELDQLKAEKRKIERKINKLEEQKEIWENNLKWEQGTVGMLETIIEKIDKDEITLNNVDISHAPDLMRDDMRTTTVSITYTESIVKNPGEQSFRIEI